MPIRVQAPNGSMVEFPDGTDHATIGKVISENFAEQPQQEPIDYGNMPMSAVLSHSANNLGTSAKENAKAFIDPFLHPIDTAKNLAHLGYGAASKVAGAAGYGNDDPEAKAARESTADAVGQFYKERYGSEAGFKKAIAEDPVGVVADLTTFFTGGGTAAARVPGAVGRAGAVVRDTARAVDPVRRTGQAAEAVAGVVVPRALSLTTGQGAEVFPKLRQAGQQGGSAQDAAYGHMRPDSAQGRPVTEPVRMAEAGIKTLEGAKNAEYQAGMAPIMAQGGQVSYTPVYTALQRVRDSVMHKGLAKDPDGVKILDEIEDTLLQYDVKAGNGIADADALKQAVGKIWERTKEDSRGERVASQAYHAIKAEIEKQAPAYADVSAGYSAAMDELGEVKRVLSLTENATDDTSLRKLQSVMRNNVQASWGHRANLAETLATKGGQPDLPYALAGQSASQWEPRGLARMAAGTSIMGGATTGAAMTGSAMPLAAIPAMAIASPRLTGEAAIALGRVERALQKLHLPPERINQILYASGITRDEVKETDKDESKRLREILMRRAAADRGQR
jgi:hypothetical protein